MLDLESWREQLCPRDINHNRAVKEHTSPKGKKQDLRGSHSRECWKGLKEVVRSFLHIHPHPHDLQATEDLVEYFN